MILDSKLITVLVWLTNYMFGVLTDLAISQSVEWWIVRLTESQLMVNTWILIVIINYIFGLHLALTRTNKVIQQYHGMQLDKLTLSYLFLTPCFFQPPPPQSPPPLTNHWHLWRKQFFKIAERDPNIEVWSIFSVQKIKIKLLGIFYHTLLLYALFWPRRLACINWGGTCNA